MHPFGFRFFWLILKRHSKKHSKLYGRNITAEITGEWYNSPEVTLKSSMDGQHNVETTYRYLKWNDLVAEQLCSNYFKAIFFSNIYLLKMIISGDLVRLYRYYWGFGNGILAISFFSVFFFYGGIALGVYLMGFLGVHFIIGAVIGGIIGTATCAIISGGKDRLKIKLYYQLAYMRGRYAKGKATEFYGRFDEFEDKLRRAYLEDDCDEVLVIGHSYGSLLVVDLLAKVFNSYGDQPPKAKKWGLVTLGAIHHYLAVLKQAGWYRDALKTVGSQRDFYWFEGFSLQDGLNFPKCNPVRDFTDIESLSGPVQKSVKYKELVTKENYKKYKYNFWQMHFQYLKEGDYAGDYSFFRMICSDQSLENNYGLSEKERQNSEGIDESRR